MSVKVIAELEIKNNPGNAVADAHRVRGLYGPCATHVERNDIPDDVRRRDMRVITSNDGKQWQLLSAGPWAHDDTDWFEVTAGSSGGSGDAGAALRAMGNLIPMEVATEPLQILNEEIHSIAYRRGAGPSSGKFNDLLIVSSDGLSSHTLSSYIPGSSSAPSYPSSPPVVVSGLTEPGEVYVVTLPAQSLGDEPKTLIYILGATILYEVTQEFTYTSPTGFMGGFMARVTDTTVSPSCSALLVTCPSTDRILCLSLQPQSVAGGLPVSLASAPGSNPRGICATDTGTFWISFPGSGVVEEFTFLAGHALHATGLTASVAIVSNLVFDGKYIWGLSLGSPVTLHRIRASDGAHTSVEIVDVQSTTAVTAYSRVGFDGATIFVTTQGGIFFQVHPETLEVIYSSKKFAAELGAMAVSGYGLPAQIEVAFAVGTGTIPGSLIRVDRGQDLSAAWVINRGAGGSSLSARLNWPVDPSLASIIGDNVIGSVCMTLASRILSNYASSLAGIGHTIIGDYAAVISGQNCTVSGPGAVAGGNGATASGQSSLAFGTGNTIADGLATLAFGINCQVLSAAPGGTAKGFGSLSRLAGEQASSSSSFSFSGTSQRSTWTGAVQLTGSFGDCQDFTAGNFTTVIGFVYGIDVTVVATNTAGTARARFDRKLLVHDAGAGPVIDSELEVFSYNVGMPTVTVTFIPSGQDLLVRVSNVGNGRAVADLVIQTLQIG